jgi:non-SMC mitotic condensation complex subunit 1, N-term
MHVMEVGAWLGGSMQVPTPAMRASQAERDAHSAASAAAIAAPPAGRRGRKKPPAEALLEWDWEPQRARVMRAVWGLAEVDMWKLFRPRPPDDAFLQRWIKMVGLRLPAFVVAGVLWATNFPGQSHAQGCERLLMSPGPIGNNRPI